MVCAAFNSRSREMRCCGQYSCNLVTSRSDKKMCMHDRRKLQPLARVGFCQSGDVLRAFAKVVTCSVHKHSIYERASAHASCSSRSSSWILKSTATMCYTEKATPARHRPERQYNACPNRRKQCSTNETKTYSKPATMCNANCAGYNEVVLRWSLTCNASITYLNWIMRTSL